MSVKSLKTGTRSISLLAGNTPEHHVLIAETTVGAGGVSSVTFSNIPNTYQHLQLRAIIRTARNSYASTVKVRLNSDSGSNYAAHQLYGTGSSAASNANVSQTSLGILEWGAVGSTALANTFPASVTDILDYASTSKNKTLRAIGGRETNDTNGLVFLNSGLWMSTSAVTSISVFESGGENISQYSTFSLYGVK